MIDGETVERDGVLAPPTLQSPAFGPRADDHGAPRCPTPYDRARTDRQRGRIWWQGSLGWGYSSRRRRPGLSRLTPTGFHQAQGVQHLTACTPATAHGASAGTARSTPAPNSSGTGRSVRSRAGWRKDGNAGRRTRRTPSKATPRRVRIHHGRVLMVGPGRTLSRVPEMVTEPPRKSQTVFG